MILVFCNLFVCCVAMSITITLSIYRYYFIPTGSNTLKIVSQVFGIFTIKLDLQKANVDTIIKKAAQCTGVPPQYLQLYPKYNHILLMMNIFYSLSAMIRLEEYKAISDINSINDDDTLILRLKPPHKLLRNYGKDSYIPMQEQTMKGIAKFYSILRHLVILLIPSITKCAIAFQAHDDKIDHNAVVAGVMKLTECPPLATALHHILTFQTFSYLSYLVTIGCFKTILVITYRLLCMKGFTTCHEQF